MPTDISIQHVYSPEYRSILSDNCLITTTSDQIGDRVVVTLTKMANKTLSEPAVRHNDGSFDIPGGITPVSELVRMIEVSAEMRPDHAVALIKALQMALVRLPQDRWEKYGITAAILGDYLPGASK